MVVGNGMIANAFKQYVDDDKVIIFASGVSNSKETSEKEFKREEDLLRSLDKSKLLIYFGTCSVNDPTIQRSPYVAHKICMEYVIRYQFKKSIIFRLPIVVGNTKNPNTFFNYFKEKISSESEVEVDLLASRYLIDADDLSEILSKIIDQYKSSEEFGQKQMTIAFNNKTMVTDIIDMMMEILGKKSDITLTHKGCDYQFDKKTFDDYLNSIDYKIPDNYTYNLLKKYLS